MPFGARPIADVARGVSRLKAIARLTHEQKFPTISCELKRLFLDLPPIRAWHDTCSWRALDGFPAFGRRVALLMPIATR
jgi:hypothetical protein